MMKNIRSKVAALGLLAGAVVSHAAGTTAVDMSGLQTAATDQLGTVGTILVAVGGTIVAIVAVIAGVRFVKRIVA